MDGPRHTSTRIVLIRHAEAAYETAGNGDSGGSLTQDGRDHARDLGKRLNSLHPSVVLCSELSRAVQTAEIAASILSIPVEVRVGLEEYDVGEERGRPYDPEVFEPLLRHWLNGQLSAGVSGGEDGHTVARRLLAVLEDAASRYPGKAVAVISHGGAINSVIGFVAPGTIDALELSPCGMVVLTVRDGEWELSLTRD